MNATLKPIEATSTGLPISGAFGAHLFEVASQSSHSPAVARHQCQRDMASHGVATVQASTPAAQAMLGAFNASNLASSYIERGNFAAARRKLMQALQSINRLQAEG